MSVLLIGSTGMGKSTLGNYLLDPDDKHMFDNQTFATSTDNRPMTQEVKSICQKVQINNCRNESLEVIDTPGLNEDAEKDLSHMIEIIRKLNNCKEIKACILVVKFKAKIDVQYKATLEYYSKLLPGLFERNVIIVMTDYATDDNSVKRRERLRIDVEQVKRNTILELDKCTNSQITYSPQIFMIDCLPNSDEMETSQNERTAILEHIFQLPPTKVENLQVAKTDYVKQKDAKKYEKLQGEIEGYKERLKEQYKDSEKVLDDTHQKGMRITQVENEIQNLEKKLRDKNTPENIVAAHWSISEEGRMFRWFTREFSIESEHEITKYTTWTNGYCKFKEIVQTSKLVKGKVGGRFMRGIYASVTAHTEKRMKYTEEITDLQRHLKMQEEFLIEFKKDRQKYRNDHVKKSREIELLEKCIAERNDDAAKCLSDLMTMEEAMSRLNDEVAK
uniref:AIG1-type G domain-containing protein n=1 Tax=Amphimedon queenslandica TaxID=400682 RepID=A0A1X7TWD0_AMPQE